MNYGWIKLHRSLLDNPHASDPDWLAVWIYLMLNATHARESHTIKHAGLLMRLGAGQLITNRFEIADKMGVEPSKVYRVLKLMESEQQIEQQPCNKSTMITVLNWSTYQKVNNKVNSD